MSGFFYFRINGKHLLVQNTTVLAGAYLPLRKKSIACTSFRQKKIVLLALKNIITDMGRIPLFQCN